VLAVGGLCIGATLNLIVTTHVIGAPEAFPYIIFAENVASFLGLPVFLWIARRYGKHRSFAVAASCYVLGFAVCFFYGQGDLWPFAVTRAVTGAALLGITVVGASLTADVLDRDRLETGEARTGLFFALLGMATKLSIAVGVLLGTTLPALGGFQPSDPVHTPEALLSLRLVYCFLAPAIMLPGIWLMWNHPLTREVQQQLRREIDARRNTTAAVSA
jgi:Na+/melibiose symporter-like transporter